MGSANDTKRKNKKNTRSQHVSTCRTEAPRTTNRRRSTATAMQERKRRSKKKKDSQSQSQRERGRTRASTSLEFLPRSLVTTTLGIEPAEAEEVEEGESAEAAIPGERRRRRGWGRHGGGAGTKGRRGESEQEEEEEEVRWGGIIIGVGLGRRVAHLRRPSQGQLLPNYVPPPQEPGLNYSEKTPDIFPGSNDKVRSSP